jgi:hypothetical protein
MHKLFAARNLLPIKSICIMGFTIYPHTWIGLAVTVAIHGDATVLLIAGDAILVVGEEQQLAWWFPLQQGECYILSDNARNRCLHAVVADDDNKDRESLYLRFGWYMELEPKDQSMIFWEDAQS